MPKGYYKHSRRHGMFGTRVYRMWAGMLQRCTNPQHNRFQNYGGRGIKVCEEWHDFKAFYTDMGDPPEKATLDRLNAEGNYEPKNCRWATQKQQQNNRRNNLRLTLQGVTKTAAEWSEEKGINPNTLYDRKRRGWTDERALTQPVRSVSDACAGTS